MSASGNNFKQNIVHTMKTQTNKMKMKKLRLLFLLLTLISISIIFHGILLNASTKKPILNHSEYSLTVGSTLKLKVNANGSSLGTITWYSSNQKIAKVNSSGKVTTYSDGIVKITAKLTGGDNPGLKLGCKLTVEPKKDELADQEQAEVEEENNPKNQKTYSFRYESYLEEHYKKHGIEMGFESKEEYLKAANAVITNPNALHKLEAEDGDHVYYVESTNEIVFLSRDGYLRTYFECWGKGYFERQ